MTSASGWPPSPRPATLPNGSPRMRWATAQAISRRTPIACWRACSSETVTRNERELVYRRLTEAMHEGVAVDRDGIRLANARFAELCGATSPTQLTGRQLTDLVHPDYADLLGEIVRRHRERQSSPERFEAELGSTDGPGRRLEFAFAPITFEGQPALLVTVVEMSAEPKRSEARGHGTAWEALDALGEGVLTTDAEGLIVYANKAAELLIGKPASDALGHTLQEVISLVDEGDRKTLGDPVRQCLTTGARVHIGRRGMVVSNDGGGERSIELTVSPLRNPAGDVAGSVIALRDVSDLRGLTRQMSYQASHDALTGLVNRREFERRLQEALEAAQAGGQKARALLPRPRPVQGGQRRMRPRRRRQHAARGRRPDQGCGARFGHRRAPRRRRVRRAARRVPAREGAPDRRRRRARDRRLPLRLEGQDLQHRRERRPRRGVAGKRLARGHDRRRRFGLLRGEEAGRPRARLLGARRGIRTPARRDPLAAATAVRAEGRPLRAACAADRGGRRRDVGGPGSRGAAAAEGRHGSARRSRGVHGRCRALPADAARRSLGGADGAGRARPRSGAPGGRPAACASISRGRRSAMPGSSSSSWIASTARAWRRTASVSR